MHFCPQSWVEIGLQYYQSFEWKAHNALSAERVLIDACAIHCKQPGASVTREAIGNIAASKKVFATCA
jgi:hypothetical protein